MIQGLPQGQRSNRRLRERKHDFYQIMLGTCVILHFHRILTGKSICGIILEIEGHLQGQKFNSKIKGIKNSVIYMFDVILTE